MNIVTRMLIAKEIHVNRAFMIGATFAGLVSVGFAALGRVGFNVGALTWITTVVALGVMLALYGVMNERKEHSLQFVLSLPIDVGDYVRAKQIGLAICFFIPWLVSSIAAIVLVAAKADIPDGLLPYTVLLCIFMLANFSLVLCGALHATTDALMTTTIVITNMAITLFMFIVGGIPSIQKHMFGAVPVWNDTVWAVLAAELAILAIAFALPHFVAARRRDFI
jgi:ABC-type transport system involved in multi-copper enzyme maturation permease subunit